MLTRRQFNAGAASLAAGALLGARGGVSYEHRGVLVRECTLPGETRADDVVPAHPNGIPLSKDRWLLVYATRGWRGVDDDLSIVYQLRKDAPDGPLVREGFLARTRNDWDPFDEGKKHVRQHGHPVAFGVPKGARLAGRELPHANLFAAKWRVCARVLDESGKRLLHSNESGDIGRRTQGVEWVQFRLNEREDDIEIVSPPGPLRPKGGEPVAGMNQSFTAPVPLNRDGSEWGDCNAFAGGRLAALRYAYSAKLGLYEWVQQGPFFAADRGIFEGSLAPWKDGWVLSARLQGGSGVAWARAEDPFSKVPAATVVPQPATTSPLTVYRSGDGVLRILTGDKGRRDPLMAWDVNPDDGFSVSGPRVLFDSVKAGLPLRPAHQPKVDMGKLLPAQGRRQFVVHRVSVRGFNHPYPNRPAIPTANPEEKAACAIYYGVLAFEEPPPPAWDL